MSDEPLAESPTYRHPAMEALAARGYEHHLRIQPVSSHTTPYVLGVSPGRRLERAAQAVAEAAPDCRGVEPVGHVSVPVALMAEQQEAMWGKKR